MVLDEFYKTCDEKGNYFKIWYSTKLSAIMKNSKNLDDLSNYSCSKRLNTCVYEDLECVTTIRDKNVPFFQPFVTEKNVY